MANVVKIDEGLLKKLKILLKDKNLKIKYSSIKQFINLSVLEKIEKEGH